MILLMHILLAITSMVWALFVLIFPSKTKLNITYLLAFGTIASGAVMTVFSPQLFGKTCITGVIYLGFIITTTLVSQKRLKSIFV